MAELTDTLKKLLKDCGLGQDAVWKHKQSGKWIVYHWALEHAAQVKGITFDPPIIVEADGQNKVAAVCVVGRLGDKTEWSIGEAAPGNNQNSYPWAMCEKRGKDRVILKLVGLHGLAYSEEEADDFKKNGTDDAKEPVYNNTNGSKSPSKGFHGPLGITELKAKMRELAGAIGNCSDTDELAGIQHAYQSVLDQCQRDLPEWYFGDGADKKGAKASIEDKRRELEAKERELEAAGQA